MMSAIEAACRWSIVQGYGHWCLDHQSRLGLVAYARALGVEPTDPPRIESAPLTEDDLAWARAAARRLGFIREGD